jgi:MerR family transcriptional regulator, heat shock protein HspR
MSREAGFELTEETPVYVISVAAELSGLHPQTLRQYDRLGLVSPGRAPGRGRRYSARDVNRLREVARMSQEEGINLAGIKRILDLVNANDELAARIAALEAELAYTLAALRERAKEPGGAYRRVNLPVAVTPPPGTALVVWRPADARRDRKP